MLTTSRILPAERRVRLSEWLRGALYCQLQALRGRPLAPMLRQVATWEALSREDFDAMHDRALADMLAYARAHVALYQSGPWAEIAAPDTSKISAWPILEKATVQKSFDAMLAQPAPGRFDRLRTSGTTGPPTTVAANIEAVVHGWAHRYRGLKWHGIPIAARALRVTHDRRFLRDLIMGQKCVWPLESPETIDEALRYLSRRRPMLVAGTPSALFFLACRLRELGVDKPLARFARVGGEQLFGFQRQQIESTLTERVINSYGTTETGAVAGECPAGSMHIYAEHLHVEVVDGDTPVTPGDFGELVITTLRNTAMPLVRYRVGDSGRVSTRRCECGLPHPILEDLQARTDDRFEAEDASSVHSSKLIEKLDRIFDAPDTQGVGQVQFYQADRTHWQVYIELPDSAVAASPDSTIRSLASQRLEEIVRETFGKECNVEAHFVENLPREHGKYRYYREQPLPT